MKVSRFLLKWARSNGVTLQTDGHMDRGYHNIPAFSSKSAGIINQHDLYFMV